MSAGDRLVDRRRSVFCSPRAWCAMTSCEFALDQDFQKGTHGMACSRPPPPLPPPPPPGGRKGPCADVSVAAHRSMAEATARYVPVLILLPTQQWHCPQVNAASSAWLPSLQSEVLIVYDIHFLGGTSKNDRLQPGTVQPRHCPHILYIPGAHDFLHKFVAGN